MTRKSTSSSKVPVRIDFEGDDAKKFQFVKKYLGLKQNTEVIRALISGKYNEIQLLEQKRKADLAKENEALEWLEKGEYKCPM
jgi:hypothetical protein